MLATIAVQVGGGKRRILWGFLYGGTRLECITKLWEMKESGAVPASGQIISIVPTLATTLHINN
jgi:hypothetical protein